MKTDCEVVIGALQGTGHNLVENRGEGIVCTGHGEVGEYNTHPDEENVDSARHDD